jgi:hypothetical protein
MKQFLAIQIIIKVGTLRRRESRDSSVGIANGYGLDDRGGREFESR